MSRLILQSMAFALLVASATLNVFAADKPKAEAERARRAEILQRKVQEEKRALESQLEAARRETETEAAAAQQAKRSLGRVQLELGKLRGSLSNSSAAQAALRADLAAGTAALAELQAQIASEREQWRLNAARAEQERSRVEAARVRLEENLSQLELMLADARARHEARERQLGERLSQTQALLARSESVRGALERSLAERTRALIASDANRQGLEKTARELLVRFQTEGQLNSDPVFQFRRVSIDNDVEAYREVIDGFMVNPESLPPR